MRLVDKPDTLAISPTAIGTARTCLRKWAFQYCTDLPRPTTEAAEFGKRTHKILEEWYSRGAWPGDVCGTACQFWSSLGHCIVEMADLPANTVCQYLKERQVASEMLEHLPYYRAHKFLTEHKVYIETDRPGLYLTGIADLQAADIPALWDFKTTGNLQYAMDASALASDPAAIIYSLAYALRFGAYPDLCWVYGRRTGKVKAVAVKARANMHLLPALLDEAHKLLQLWLTNPDPNTVEPRYIGCKDYGGCPYKGTVCGATWIDQYKADLEEEMSTCVLCNKPDAQIHITLDNGIRGNAHKACYEKLGHPEDRKMPLTEQQTQETIDWIKPYVEKEGVTYDAATLRSAIATKYGIDDVPDEQINFCLFQINGQDPTHCVPATPEYSEAAAAVLAELPETQQWRKKDVKAKVIEALQAGRIDTVEDVMAVYKARDWALKDTEAAKRIIREAAKASAAQVRAQLTVEKLNTEALLQATPTAAPTAPVPPQTPPVPASTTAAAPAPAAAVTPSVPIPQYVSGPTTVGGSSVAPYTPPAAPQKNAAEAFPAPSMPPALQQQIVESGGNATNGTVPAPVQPRIEAETAGAATPTPLRTLYLDVYVEKGEQKPLGYEALAPLIAEYEQTLGYDYRAVDYGQGIVGLCGYIRKRVEMLPPELAVLSRNWDGRIVATLRALYPVVYAGVSS